MMEYSTQSGALIDVNDIGLDSSDAIKGLEFLKELVDEFDKIPYLYIADGHHRSVSAVNVAKEKRDANPNYTGDEEFNYYIAMIAPENDLEVMDYNRVVKDLNGNTKQEFIDKIAQKFNIEKIPDKKQGKPYSWLKMSEQKTTR